MEEVVKQLKSTKECREFIIKQKKLVDETRQWSLDLRVRGCGCSMDIEKELWRAINAYEDVLTEKNNRTTLASRTRQMVQRYGIIEAAEKAVDRPIDAIGYKVLVDWGMPHLTFESVITKNPEYFKPHIVQLCHYRIGQLKIN